MPVKLSPRLQTALLYIRGSGVVADIGTDHAYLPISLCEQGILTPATEGAICAVAADINAGPVERAAIHIATAGLSDRIVTVKTDGLCGLEQYDPSDVIIFGMGGELIASILEAAPFVRDPAVRLILQPMTKQAHLCDYLVQSGFSIDDECYTTDAGKFYRTLVAHFEKGKGVPEGFAEIGFSDIPCEEIAAKIGYLSVRLASYNRARSGKITASLDTACEDALIKLITTELERLEERSNRDR